MKKGENNLTRSGCADLVMLFQCSVVKLIGALLILLCLPAYIAFGQSEVYKIIDSGTKAPLPYVTVMMMNDTYGTYTDHAGEFRINASQDSIIISSVGFKSKHIKLSDIGPDRIILLEAVPVILNDVTLAGMKLDMKKLHEIFKPVRGDLYAQRTEVTNGQYNSFLYYLQINNKGNQWEKYSYNLSSYSGTDKSFYARYQTPGPDESKRNYRYIVDGLVNYSHYPAVNISYESAVTYCNWLTEQYNNSHEKKKFRKVRFRLPTLAEWQIAALGDPEFKSWELDMNSVVVPEPIDSTDDESAGKKIVVPVADVYYPWWGAHNYRKRPQNKRNCFLANFKMPENYVPCEFEKRDGDGFLKMGRVASYFPNNMGLYDVVGNVAEMISEEGKACGGSWNDTPAHATIRSVSGYNAPGNTIGFRVFMEVVER